MYIHDSSGAGWEVNFNPGGNNRIVPKELKDKKWLLDQIEELHEKKIVTKPYLAKPKLNSHHGENYFRTLREAENYLNKYTGFNLKSDDWKMVGKILYRTFSRTTGYTYRKYTKDYLETFHVMEKIA
jgi:hypothetical protein